MSINSNSTSTLSSIDRLYRISEVEQITGLARSTIYLRLQQGQFPAPIQVGAKAVRWRQSDLQTWLEELPVVTQEAS